MDPVFVGRSDEPAKNVELGVIQRLNIDLPRVGGRTTVILCAGLGSSATMNTARYLAKYWSSAHRHFGRDEFGVVLGFRQEGPDSEVEASPSSVHAFRRVGGEIRHDDWRPG